MKKSLWKMPCLCKSAEKRADLHRHLEKQGFSTFPTGTAFFSLIDRICWMKRHDMDEMT